MRTAALIVLLLALPASSALADPPADGSGSEPDLDTMSEDPGALDEDDEEDDWGQNTVFSGDVDHGGYGGPMFSMTSIRGNGEIMAGGRGGWLIDHTLLIGGGGHGVLSDIEGELPAPQDTLSLGVGYGGFMMEAIVLPRELVHFSVSALIGGGGVSFYDRSDPSANNEELESDGFWVFEPGVHGIVNLAHFVRVYVDALYRIVGDVELEGVTNSDISGPSFGVSFMFGAF